MALPASWKNWVLKALLGGTPAEQILHTLMQNGFLWEDAQAVLGRNVPANIRSKFNHAFYRALSQPAFLTQADLPFDDHSRHNDSSTPIQLYAVPHFLSADECDAIIEAGQRHFAPSTIAATSGYAQHRTSTTCNLTFLDAPVVGEVEQKIVSFLRLGVGENEVMQAQRYQVGQEFKQHVDYFEPGTDAFRQHASVRGQRTWTFMLYLNDVKQGGETEFIKLNQRFKPVKGMALVWNNLLPSGAPNPFTLHHAHPVLSGEKYVITKWFRTLNQ